MDNGKHITHDQNFKNLILDYPREALMFFAASEAFDLSPDVRITPVRQEQLKDRLGDHFHELDTPLLVEWPDGIRATILFVAEEETEPSKFSIYRMGRYCLHLSELFKTDRVVPVVIFLRPGSHPASLTLSGDWNTYMFFRFIACDLGRIPAEKYMTSINIVARLNLPNMAHPHERRLDVYAEAREGLVELEQNLEKQIKYSEFIDLYAGLDEIEFNRYKEEYLPKSPHKEAIMGFTRMYFEEGKKEGEKKGEQRGEQRGEKKGVMLTINRLLSLRFKTVPVWAGELLKKAEQRELEQWTDRILDAKTIEEVFGKQQ